MSPPSRASDLRPVFETLYEAMYADLLRFVQRRVRHDQAEDVVSDAFLVVWRRLEELPSHSDDARAWVFGIARNLLLNDRRGGERRQALGVQLAAAAAVRPNPCDRDPQVDLVVSRVDLWRFDLSIQPTRTSIRTAGEPVRTSPASPRPWPRGIVHQCPARSDRTVQVEPARMSGGDSFSPARW